MSLTCPDGHPSEAPDYCDVCGVPMATPRGPDPRSPSAERLCPDCGTACVEDALFCEGCGFDFTTRVPGRGPDPVPAAAPGQVEWVAEVWVDPAWSATQDTAHPAPSGGPPAVVPLRGRTLLVGRPSASRNITPDIDCSTDPGVSRRHARLTTGGVRWFVEDLDSANGSFVGPATGPLPQEPVPRSTRVELGDDDRLYVGAWTRIVVRRATAAERAP